MKDIRGFDDRSVSHRDLLSVQIRMVVDGLLAVVGVHVKVDSMAAASSSQELVNVLLLVLIIVSTSSCVGGPLVITTAVPPFLVPSAADPSVHMVKLAWYNAICDWEDVDEFW